MTQTMTYSPEPSRGCFVDFFHDGSEPSNLLDWLDCWIHVKAPDTQIYMAQVAAVLHGAAMMAELNSPDAEWLMAMSVMATKTVTA